MTSEINQLLEEAVTRSAELGDTADEAMSAIDGMVKNAETLAERVREEGSETQPVPLRGSGAHGTRGWRNR